MGNVDWNENPKISNEKHSEIHNPKLEIEHMEMPMKRMALIFLVGWIGYWGISVGQEIYRWVDEKGTVHFADDITLVPERYRNQVEKKELPQKPSATPAKPSVRSGPSEPTPTQSTPEKKDLLGRGEDWWKARMKEGRDKLQTAQKNYDLTSSELKQKEKELEEAKFKPDSLKRKLKAEIKALAEKLKEREKERDEAKNMVEKVLPKEAEDYKADPAWLKPEE